MIICWLFAGCLVKIVRNVVTMSKSTMWIYLFSPTSSLNLHIITNTTLIKIIQRKVANLNICVWTIFRRKYLKQAAACRGPQAWCPGCSWLWPRLHDPWQGHSGGSAQHPDYLNHQLLPTHPHTHTHRKSDPWWRKLDWHECLFSFLEYQNIIFYHWPSQVVSSRLCLQPPHQILPLADKGMKGWNDGSVDRWTDQFIQSAPQSPPEEGKNGRVQKILEL